jgi:hypothetical protein
MATYRLKRNLESSLIDFFRDELTNDGWNGIAVEKNIKQEEIKLPAIIVYASSVDNQKKEIGGSKYLRFPIITIRIFATSEGQRQDLSDWVLEKLEDDISYYAYVITNGAISSKTLSGNIVITKILRDSKDLENTNPESLELEDRYRHILTFSTFIGEI